MPPDGPNTILTLGADITAHHAPIALADAAIPALQSHNMQFEWTLRPRLPDHLKEGCQLEAERTLSFNEELGSLTYLARIAGCEAEHRLIVKLFGTCYWTDDESKQVPPSMPWENETAMRAKYARVDYPSKAYALFNEMLAYGKACHLQGTVLPHFYGAFVLESSTVEVMNANRVIYALLIEDVGRVNAYKYFSQPLEATQVKHMFSKTLAAYIRLHGCDITHLDITAANVLIVEKAENDIDPVLIDFAMCESISAVRHQGVWSNTACFPRILFDVQDTYYEQESSVGDPIWDWEKEAEGSGALALMELDPFELRRQ